MTTSRVATLDDLADAITQLGNQIAKHLAGFEARMNRRFDRLEQRMDKAECRLGA